MHKLSCLMYMHNTTLTNNNNLKLKINSVYSATIKYVLSDYPLLIMIIIIIISVISPSIILILTWRICFPWQTFWEGNCFYWRETMKEAQQRHH